MIKKLLAAGLLAVSMLATADTFSLFAPADGLLVGDQDTYVTTSATSTDVRALWSGTCDSSSFLRGDGACAVPVGTAPAGTNTQVQFNNAGAFGASASLTWNGSTLSATSFTGSGSGLTGIPDAALSSNVPLLNSINSFTAQNIFDTSNISVNISGAGTGTGADYPLRVVAAAGAAARNLAIFAHSGITNGAQFTSNGSNVNLTLNGGTITADGSGLTNVPDGALSSNVALKNASNTFTGAAQTVSATNAQWNATDSSVQAGIAALLSDGVGVVRTISNHPLQFRTNNTDRGGISAAGNWTINAPVSGTTTVTNVVPEANGATWTDGTRTLGIYTSAAISATGVGSISNHALNLYTNSVTRVGITTAGNVEIGSPSSGYPLYVTGDVRAHLPSGSNSLFRGYDFGIVGNGSSYGNIGMNMTSGEMRHRAGFAGWGGTHTFYTDGDERFWITAAGNVGVNAPGSGTTLALTGLNNTNIQTWSDGTTQATLYADSSNRLVFGTDSNHPLRVFTNSTYRAQFDAGLQLGSPTGGDKGAGTLNTAGQIYQNNVPVCLSDGTNCPSGGMAYGYITVGSSSCSVSRSSRISGCSWGSAGLTSLTLTGFSNFPVCTASADYNALYATTASMTVNSSSSVSIYTYHDDTGGPAAVFLADTNYNITCIGT